MPKLCTLVAYYPTALPNVNAGFPPSVRVLAHLAGKKNKSSPKWASYMYPHAETGFAETDLEEYDKVSASLAWSRTLDAVRKGFGIEVDLEGVWEKHLARGSSQFPTCSTSIAAGVLILTERVDTASRVPDQRRQRNNVHHGPSTLRKPHPNPHRRHRLQGPAPLLQGFFHLAQSSLLEYPAP